MKRKKCIAVLVILLAVVFYALTLIYPTGFGLVAATAVESTASLSVTEILWLISSWTLLCTPLFCVLATVVSALLCAKEKYLFCYLTLLLPIATVLLGAILFVASILIGWFTAV